MPSPRILALSLGLLAATGPASAADLDALAWLVGDWRAEPDSVVLESWRRLGPTTFEGVGEVRCAETDTLISRETLRLVEMSGGIYYIAKVAHNDLPIPFALIESGDDGFVFANDAHDFTQRLVYERESAGFTVSVRDTLDNGFDLRFHPMD